jgi:hypothetical protein
MSGFYHGSRLRHVVGRAGFFLRQIVKSGAKRKFASEALNQALSEYDALVARRDWQGLKPHVVNVVALATSVGEHQVVQRMAQALERLGEYDGAADLRLRARKPEQRSWKGESLDGKSLLINLVEDNPQSLGRVIRHLGLAGFAAQSAGSATIILEPRLHPLVRRTFPSIQVGHPGAHAVADFYATFEDLQGVYGRDASRLASVFTPLQADPHLSMKFRKRYSNGSDLPLIGLSWGSKSHTKDVPDFSEWNQFVNVFPGQFVSLQYGEVGGALRMLREGSSRPLIHDKTVDQMVDMDSFAAQIAALDAVVTISNTAAHLAGALGVPTVFLIDDKFHTAWPVMGERTPWYPNGVVLRRDGRGWDDTLAEASERLAAMIAGERYPSAGNNDGS